MLSALLRVDRRTQRPTKKISHMCVQFVSFCEERVISFGLFFEYANNNPAQNV
jgi:hypothetical protein